MENKINPFYCLVYSGVIFKITANNFDLLENLWWQESQVAKLGSGGIANKSAYFCASLDQFLHQS